MLRTVHMHSVGFKMLAIFIFSFYFVIKVTLTRTDSWSILPDTSSALSPTPIHRRHVAVFNTPTYHTDVYASLAWHVERLFQRNPSVNGTVTIYEKEAQNGYTQFVREIGMSSVPSKPVDEFLADMERTDLYGDEGDMIDVIISGSCHQDMEKLVEPLNRLWEARLADKKFKVGCIIHGAGGNWIDILEPFLRRKSMAFSYLSQHVLETHVKQIYEFAGAKEERKHGGYEYLQTGVYTPVADFTPLIVPKEVRFPAGLSKAAVQGNFNQPRRDYKGLFENLLASLAEGPSAWGYLPLSSDNLTARYKPDMSGDILPFELHLLGGGGHVDIPSQLRDIVTIHWQLPSKQYYDVLQSMDVILPTFTGSVYYTDKASSSIHSALQVNVPILVESRHRQSYRFLDDAVTIVRPHAMTEIDAIKALRTGIAPKIDEDYHPALASDIKRMIDEGWRRLTAPFNAFKQRLWDQNEAYLIKILNH